MTNKQEAIDLTPAMQTWRAHSVSITHKLPFLSDTELRAIAEPLRQSAAIMRWFRQQGFEVKRKPNGMPLISRTHFEAVMCGRLAGALSSNPTAVEESALSPNTAAFVKRFGKRCQV